MGSGRWDATTYSSTASFKEANSIPTFAYSATMDSTPRSLRTAHEMLDPTAVAGPSSPFAGSVMREARDSDEHPESLPIAVIFDVTGSMREIPKVLQAKLPDLFGLLMRKGYVADPQILMGAVGDVNSDSVPYQIGQFESDNRIDDTLTNIYLEGGGGGGNHESYADVAYLLAHHTATDAWDKRGKRGYVFFIGDERLYAKVRAAHVEKMTGTNPGEDQSTASVFAALQERYDVYYLFCSEGSYNASEVLDASAASDSAIGWREVLGQNAIVLEDASAVCETIALTIGVGEGTIDLDEGLEHLAEIGSTAGAAVGKALAHVGSGGGGGSIVVADAPEDLEGGNGVTRL